MRIPVCSRVAKLFSRRDRQDSLPAASNESLQATRPNDDGLPLRDVPSLAASINSGVGPVA